MAEMKTYDVLRRAADLVDQGWTQGAFARLADGQSCRSRDSDAASFCLVGALDVAGYQASAHVYSIYPSCLSVLRALLNKRGEIDLAVEGFLTWNDNPDRKKREVVDLLLEAARAEEEADG